MDVGYRWLGWVASWLAGASQLVGCAHPSRMLTSLPVPQTSALPKTSALMEQMHAARSAVRAYSAEARVTYVGPQGRIKGTASGVVMRPDKMRWEVHAPHGGVVLAFATDGQHAQLLDFKNNRWVSAPAQGAFWNKLFRKKEHASGIDWGATDGVGLMFGEVAIPPTARVTYDLSHACWVGTWMQAGHAITVGVDQDSARMRWVSIEDHSHASTTIHVLNRDEQGLPQALQVKTAFFQADIRLRDVERNIPVDNDIFTLKPARGMKRVSLNAW